MIDVKEHIRIIIFLLVITAVVYSCSKAVVSIVESPKLDASKAAVAETPAQLKETGFEKAIDLADSKAYSVAAADFNNDGYNDVVLGIFGGQSRIFINNKGESFSMKILTDKKYYTEAVAAIDFDKDSRKDIIIGNNQQPIVLLKNNGDGSFSIFKELDKTVAKDIAVADFDKNGYDDFAVGTQSKENFVYFNSNGEFTRLLYSENMPITSIEAADFNNDGYADIVVGAARKPTRVYMNNEGKDFSLAAEIGDVPNTESISAGDFNNDGKTDIIQGNNKENNLLIINKGDSFEKKPMFGKGNTYVILNADLDNDKHDEVIVGNYEETIQIYKGYDGNYELVKEIEPPFKNYVRGIAAADFNNDGKIDLAVAREKGMSQVYLS